MTFNSHQKDLVFGTLLGDGNLQTETYGRTWRYRALHKTAHFPYLQHKYDVLRNYCSTGPIYGKVYDERSEKEYQRHYFNTTVHNDFRLFGNMFYTYDPKLQKMVKQVPTSQHLGIYLTPRAIAYWYMDDGALKWLNHSNAMRICTESFSKDDVLRLRNFLFERYKIKTEKTIKTRNRVYIGDRISIPEKSSDAFRELIRPYLIDCMKYKVSDGNRGHL